MKLQQQVINDNYNSLRIDSFKKTLFKGCCLTGKDTNITKKECFDGQYKKYQDNKSQGKIGIG